MPVAKQNYTFRDAKGNTARFSFYVSGATATLQATAAGNVSSALTPLTNAHLQAGSGPDTRPPSEVVYGTNAEYASVEDKAMFVFQTAAGATHRYQVPAPIAAIFKTDGETIDATNTAVIAFVSAMIANATDANGNAIAFGANGTRLRRKIRRRLNIFVKDSSLSGPAE